MYVRCICEGSAYFGAPCAFRGELYEVKSQGQQVAGQNEGKKTASQQWRSEPAAVAVLSPRNGPVCMPMRLLRGKRTNKVHGGLAPFALQRKDITKEKWSIALCHK